VEAIEALLEQVNRARERLDRVPLILKKFRQAVLAAACSGRLTEDWRDEVGRDAAWETTTVDGVCETVVDCPHSTPKWSATGEVCLRTTNFFATGLDVREVRYVSAETYRERAARLVPAPDDVVYSREGGILGIACVIPKGLRACLGQRMMLMRPDATRVRAAYLCAVLNSPGTNATVRELTGGTAARHALLAVEGMFLLRGLGFVEFSTEQHRAVLRHARDIVAGVLAKRRK
jgi:type I restriction enzyme, S subunit